MEVVMNGKSPEQRYDDASAEYHCLLDTFMPIGRRPTGTLTIQSLQQLGYAQRRANEAHEGMVRSWMGR